MKFTSIILPIAAFADSISAVAAPRPAVDNTIARAPAAIQQERDASIDDLWKRKGGGGSGGKTGGGGGGSSGGKPAGGGSSGGGGSPRPAPAYGGAAGGGYYSGGAKTAYKPGTKSPSGILPFALGGAALGVAAYTFWPSYGLWAHPIYYYPYHNPYHYYNHSSAKNETRNVGCGCDQTQDCACDEDPNIGVVLNQLVGNGSYAGLNQSIISVGDVNGTQTLLLNGTLPLDDDDSDDGTAGAAPGGNAGVVLRHAGWWPVVALVWAVVFLG